MKNVVRAADRLVGEAFAPYFPDALPPCLGQEAYQMIRRRLRAAGRYLDDEHAEEVFQRAVFEAYSYLMRYGNDKIRHVRGWFLQISVRATLRYLSERSRFDSSSISSLNDMVDHETRFPDSSYDTSREWVREAIHNLRPRYREIIVLGLVDDLPSTEVQKRMKIASSNYFRKLKCEATKALREELSRHFH